MNNHSRNEPPNQETMPLLLLAVAIFMIFFYFLFSNTTGEVTPKKIMDFVGATVTSLSLGITFALAILAVNVFGYSKKIERVKKEMQNTLDSALKRASVLEQMLSVFPNTFEKITEGVTIENKSYFAVLHTRFFIKLMRESDSENKLKLCRDIVGSMEEFASVEILKQTRPIMVKLKDELPSEAESLDVLILKADSILLQEQEEQEQSL